MEQVKKVLIIDDEPQTTKYFSTLLEDNGFIAHCANNADEGMGQIQALNPDLILLDLMMPSRSGIILFNKIKRDARYRDIPIIIVTGIQTELPGDHKAFFNGLKLHKPSAYLEKPVDPERLIETVTRTLACSN